MSVEGATASEVCDTDREVIDDDATDWHATGLPAMRRKASVLHHLRIWRRRRARRQFTRHQGSRSVADGQLAHTAPVSLAIGDQARRHEASPGDRICHRPAPEQTSATATKECSAGIPVARVQCRERHRSSSGVSADSLCGFRFSSSARSAFPRGHRVQSRGHATVASPIIREQHRCGRRAGGRETFLLRVCRSEEVHRPRLCGC